jgi:hypothetical protein
MFVESHEVCLSCYADSSVQCYYGECICLKNRTEHQSDPPPPIYRENLAFCHWKVYNRPTGQNLKERNLKLNTSNISSLRRQNQLYTAQYHTEAASATHLEASVARHAMSHTRH